MDKQNCEHKFWENIGEWDGEDLKTGEPNGGPIIKCMACGLEKNATYSDWSQILKAMEAEKEKVMKVKLSAFAKQQKEDVKKYLPQKRPLWFYVIAVLVVLAILNLIIHVLSFSFGFLLGMLAMYIAVHFYRYK